MSTAITHELKDGVEINATQQETNESQPFINHPQLAVIIDILIRQRSHHVLLESELTNYLQKPFLEALQLSFKKENINRFITQCELYYFDLLHQQTNAHAITQEFKIIQQHAIDNNRCAIICLNANIDDICLEDSLNYFINTPQLRFILFSANTKLGSSLTDHFSAIKLTPPMEYDLIQVIEQESHKLSHHHHVIIPSELLNEAYQLAKRYLSSGGAVKNTILLLDSSAARAAGQHQSQDNSAVKPVLTATTLKQTLSSWTNIPSSHLSLNKFASGNFVQALQQRIFGQDVAINLICQTLQHAHAGLQGNHGTFASILLPGPKFTGKKTMAICLAQHLFGHLGTLFFVDPKMAPHDLAELKVQRQSDHQYLSLKKAITQIPYAIFLFEDIESAPVDLINELSEIISTGYLNSKTGEQYDFAQAIMLFSTTCGSAHLNHLFAPQPSKEQINQLDLMQLVLQQEAEKPAADHFTAEAIIDKIMPQIKAALTGTLIQHVAIAPFLPIHREGIEKIIQLKLKTIAEQLEERHHIHFSYAPEVVRFVADESINTQPDEDASNIAHALQQLYISIEQTILFNEKTPNRPNQLFLQLNETGEALRCHWLDSAATM